MGVALSSTMEMRLSLPTSVAYSSCCDLHSTCGMGGRVGLGARTRGGCVVVVALINAERRSKNHAGFVHLGNAWSAIQKQLGVPTDSSAWQVDKAAGNLSSGLHHRSQGASLCLTFTLSFSATYTTS